MRICGCPSNRSASGEPPASIVVPVRYLLAFWLFVLRAWHFWIAPKHLHRGTPDEPEYGLGDQKLGLIFKRVSCGYAIFQVPAGWLGNTLGPRLRADPGAIWWGVTTACTAATAIDDGLCGELAHQYSFSAGGRPKRSSIRRPTSLWRNGCHFESAAFINGLIFAGVGAGVD